MRFLEFKDKYFDGDEEKALIQLAHEGYTHEYEFAKTEEGMKDILDSMDRITANRYMYYLRMEIKDFKKTLQKTGDYTVLLCNLNMSEDEIANGKNPFVKKFWLTIGTVAAGMLIMLAALFVMKKANINNEQVDNIVSYAMSIFIGLRAMTAASQLINVFRFRKAKKMIAAKADATSDDTGSGSAICSSDSEEACVSSEGESASTDDDEQVAITRAMCINRLRTMSKDRKSTYLAFSIFAPIFFIIMTLEAKIFIILGVACSFLCFIQYQKYKKIYESVNDLNFYIKTDICVDKKYSYDREDDMVSNFRIFFKNGGKYTINMSHVGLFFQTASEISMYNTFEPDEKCYTVYVGDNKKILYAFPIKYFIISESEFKRTGDYYYPLKDIPVEEIVETKEKIQRSDLLPVELKNVEKAEEAVEKTLKKAKKYVFFSVVTIALTLLGMLSGMLQALNVLVQPFLFIIPFIFTAIAVSKSKKAVDRIAPDYIGRPEILKKQLLGMLSLLLLFVNIFAYFGNMVLMVVMRVQA